MVDPIRKLAPVERNGKVVPMIPQRYRDVTSPDGRLRGVEAIPPEEIIETIDTWFEVYPELAARPEMAKHCADMRAAAVRDVEQRRAKGSR